MKSKGTSPQEMTVFLLLVFGIFIPYASGDGMFVWNKKADLYEPSQKAIIHWDEGKETLILQVKYEGPAEDFGWIVPLPAEPEVTAIDADKSPFAELSLYTQRRVRIGTRSAGGEEDLTVLQRKVVGLYDIAVLASNNADALNNWLRKNGFSFPKDKSDIFEYYTRKHWFYVAMKIEPDALKSNDINKLKTGELQPIRFCFASDEMVYPLKVSSANAGETELLLYLLADAPMVLNNENQPEGFSIEQNLPQHLTSINVEHIDEYMDFQYGSYKKVGQKTLPLTWAGLGIPDETELCVCKYRAVYTPEQMTEDLVFSAFSPLNYWPQYFSINVIDESLPLTNYQMEFKRQFACLVFGYYDPAILKILAYSKYKENRELAAVHPKTPDILLIKLAQDSEFMVKINLLQNNKLPSQALRILAKDDYSGLRSRIASHSNAPSELLYDLVEDENWQVRASVMGHPEATLEILKKLLDDPEASTRASLANRKDIPTEWLIRLSKDNDSQVRAAVAQQQNLPKSIKERLTKDPSEQVRRALELSQKEK